MICMPHEVHRTIYRMHGIYTKWILAVAALPLRGILSPRHFLHVADFERDVGYAKRGDEDCS